MPYEGKSKMKTLSVVPTALQAVRDDQNHSLPRIRDVGDLELAVVSYLRTHVSLAALRYHASHTRITIMINPGFLKIRKQSRLSVRMLI